MVANPLENLISEHDYAVARGVSVRTVRRDRELGVGPAFIRMGRFIFYRKEAIEAWLNSIEQRPVREADHAARS